MIFKSKRDNTDVQNLLLSISRQFIYATPAEIDNTINLSLKYIAEFLNVERCYIYLFSEKKDALFLANEFLKRDISTKINHHDEVDGADFEWLLFQLNKSKPLIINNINKQIITITNNK